jgi:hypothetical protein
MVHDVGGSLYHVAEAVFWKVAFRRSEESNGRGMLKTDHMDGTTIVGRSALPWQCKYGLAI